MFVTILGFIAAALTSFSFLAQVIKTWKTKQTKDISLNMYLILGLGISLWIVYGFLIQDIVVISANIVAISFILIIISLKIKHG